MSAGTAIETRPAPTAVETITVKVDDKVVSVPKLSPDHTGKLVPTTMIQACFAAGTMVPHYCYHPKLPVAGNCRMCLVEFGTPAMGPDRKPIVNPDGSTVVRKAPRPAIACATPVSPGMEIYCSTPSVQQMREGVLESLLINHPLDCPICDQAGECKLQEYSVDYGQSGSRFVEAKVHKPKRIDLGPRIVLDAERCILCTRCIRFTRDVAGDDALGIVNRGSYNTISTFPGKPFDNNYTLNTVDICPVGALTSKDFRFQMRVWFLKETRSLCTSCATGCNITVGSRENTVHRYEPRDNDAVNGSWMCDAGRLNYKWINRADRLREVRAGSEKVSWQVALKEIAEKLKAAPLGSVAIIASARLSNEELFLLRKLASRLEAITDVVRREGAADALLVSADKNPNTTGARLHGMCFTEVGINLAKIASGIDRGTIKTLIVFGENMVKDAVSIGELSATEITTEAVEKHGLGPDLLAKLDTFIVSDILPNDTTRLAHYLLPGCAHVEKRGTFTSTKGRVQKFTKAIEPPGEARPEWEFLHELVQEVVGRDGIKSLEGLFNQMAKEVPAFRGLTWAGLGDTGSTVET
jgi:NADH-quinone oxidoreductase subunit G